MKDEHMAAFMTIS